MWGCPCESGGSFAPNKEEAVYKITYRDLLWRAYNGCATIDELEKAWGFYRTSLDNGDLDEINEDWGEEDGPLTEEQVEEIITELEEQIKEHDWLTLNAY